MSVSLWLGRDLNWDFLNYHFYGASLMLDGRLSQDYFAASLQSYLNPLVYVPQYLMIQAGWHSLLVGALLAALHSLNLVFSVLITRQLLPGALRDSAALALLAAILALLAPLFLTTSGTSFSDPTTSVLVLAALWLLLDAQRADAPAVRSAVVAGALLGVASGLKITNAVLTAAIVGSFIFSWWLADRRRWAAAASALLVACAAGWLLSHGYWSMELWREFGNPVFPLFNGFFQSPDFPAITFRDERFVGAGPVGLLTLPFEMLAPVSWLYAENVAVDVRFAVLVLLLGAAGLVALVGRARGVTARRLGVPPALAMLTAVFAACYLLWGLSSKIGRYALPLWLLLGPLIVAWAAVLLRRVDRVALLGTVVAATQTYALVVAENPRWSPAPWAERWLDVEVPSELRQRPVTLFTLGVQTYSFVIPFLHPDTRAVNLVGQYVQPAGDRMTEHLRRLVTDPAADMRIAFRDNRDSTPYDGRLTTETRRDVDAMLSVYGLRTTGADCQPLLMHLPMLSPNGSRADGQAAARSKRTEHDRLHVCPVARLTAAAYAEALVAKMEIGRAFDAIEAVCGSQLNPHRTETLRGRDGWMRVYFNSQNSIATDGLTVWVRPFRSMLDVELGPLRRWLQSPAPACPRIPASIQRPI